MVEARDRAILNFAGVNVRVPPEVVVRNVDLSTEFRILSYYLAR
jgi:NADH/NAD ratio-sensing transcriptional regulator Rex